MSSGNHVLVLVTLCLGVQLAASLAAADENLHAALNQRSAEKIETLQDAVNAPHPDVPRPSFAAMLARAEQGDAQAQHLVGRRYYFGDGVIEDRKKAVEWQTRAAEQGHATAQYILGLLYSAGEGVSQDKTKAVALITEAAEQGLAEAQHALGMMYQTGEGVAQDDAKAEEWLSRATAHGAEGSRRDDLHRRDAQRP